MTNPTKTTCLADIESINHCIFKPVGLNLTYVEAEAESQDYFAHTFKLDNQKVKFRRGKTTPTKRGHFVTLWKRNPNGIIEPFQVSDDIALYLIAVHKDEHWGLFIFPKTVLHDKGILSDQEIEGKRGIRVYGSWEITNNPQAKKTQNWQKEYFIDLSNKALVDLKKAASLLRCLPNHQS